MNRILWNIEIKTDHLILASRDKIKKKQTKKQTKQKQNKTNPPENLSSCGFCDLCGQLRENQRKQNERQVPGSHQRTKKAVEHVSNSETNCNWCARNGPDRLGKVP